MKICIFGDSVAKGIILDEEKDKYIFSENGFVSLFEKQQHIPVKNFSKFGCTISKGSKILESHAEELCNYDYTVLEFGGNDCDYNWKDISETPYNDHLPKVPLEQFSHIYKKMISAVKRSGSKPIMLSLPPLDSFRFFRCISKDLNKENILNFIHDIHFIYRWQELYNEQLFKIAKSCHIPIIDIRSKFLENKDYQKYLCADGMHPNQKGHLLILKSLHEFIENQKQNNHPKYNNWNSKVPFL